MKPFTNPTNPNPRVVYVNHSWGEMALSTDLYDEDTNNAGPTNNHRADTVPVLPPARRRVRFDGARQRAGDNRLLLRALSATQTGILVVLCSIVAIWVLCSIGPTIDREEREHQWRGERLTARGEVRP